MQVNINKLYFQGKRPEVQPAESHVTPISTTTTSAPWCYVTLGVRVTAAGGLFPYYDAPVWHSAPPETDPSSSLCFCISSYTHILGRKAHACTGKSHENTLDTEIKVEQLKKHRQKEKGREGKSGAAQEKHWAVGNLCRLCFVCFLSY